MIMYHKVYIYIYMHINMYIYIWIYTQSLKVFGHHFLQVGLGTTISYDGLSRSKGSSPFQKMVATTSRVIHTHKHKRVPVNPPPQKKEVNCSLSGVILSQAFLNLFLNRKLRYPPKINKLEDENSLLRHGPLFCGDIRSFFWGEVPSSELTWLAGKSPNLLC